MLPVLPVLAGVSSRSVEPSNGFAITSCKLPLAFTAFSFIVCLLLQTYNCSCNTGNDKKFRKDLAEYSSEKGTERIAPRHDARTHHNGSISESTRQSAPAHQPCCFPRPHSYADLPSGSSWARPCISSSKFRSRYPTRRPRQARETAAGTANLLPLPFLGLSFLSRAAQLTSHFRSANPHEIAASNGMAVAASTSPFPAALSATATAARSHRRPPPGFLPLHGHRVRVPRLGTVATRRRFRAEAMKAQREKEQTEVAVEESFPVRETAPLDGAEDQMVPTDDSWVVKLEQSVNIFLTESVVMILDSFYRDRNYARFFVLETIARVPYFAFISVLHMYETFGWWRRADYIKVHFAESMNEFHHLLIMEELGGNSLWIDRFLARFMAFFYYFMTVGMYMLSPRMAYHFSECVERHAYSTYDKFLKLHEEELKGLPAPEAAINYYLNEDLYLFDEFQTARAPCSRRPKIDNLYDVFVNIRDDEAEHCKTMKACQTHGNLRSPHSMKNCLETDTECVIPENDCEGIVDCVKRSLTSKE